MDESSLPDIPRKPSLTPSSAPSLQTSAQTSHTSSPSVRTPPDIKIPLPSLFLKPRPTRSRASSGSSITSIVDDRASSPLSKVQEGFTDQDGGVLAIFAEKLQFLTAENSKTVLSIERFLVKSEKEYFENRRKEKMSTAGALHRASSIWGPNGLSPSPALNLSSIPPSPALTQQSSIHQSEVTTRPRGFLSDDELAIMGRQSAYGSSAALMNPGGEKVLSRIQWWLHAQIGGWPIYAIILAAGQLLGATSFQLTLLSGVNTQGDLDLYVLSSIFLISSIVWYTLSRTLPSIYVLTFPWIFYGLAFFFIGIPVLLTTGHSKERIAGFATWCYAVGSSSSFLFFSLNFGEEAGAATEVWIWRSCIVQGTQQIWVAALWYWGFKLNGTNFSQTPPSPYLLLAVWPLSMFCLSSGYFLWKGLPDYYRHLPARVPNFVTTLFRRKLVIWFLISEILRDYWLSGPYGRNWSFLWNNTYIATWSITLMVFVFFGIIWTSLLLVIMNISRTHSWFLPVFAVGLGAPRWCQMLWGTSSLAAYIPWGGKAGPYLGTSLWLWLGVLDAIQGVGLGMILLQTLSRLHVSATLALAQIIGSICVMLARATAPNKIGPGTVFPNAALWDFSKGLKGSPMASPAFWIALTCQIIIVLGYLMFFRKEQLSKP